MPHQQTQTEWEHDMCIKILDAVRSELYLDLRFLDAAFSALIPKADESIQTFASDGTYLNYSARQILRVFQNNPIFLNRAYLHSVLHCIFSHLWTAGTRRRAVWNTACDIAVEYTIDEMQKPSTRRILTWLRQQMYEQLKAYPQGISAAVIYQKLLELPKEQFTALQNEFYTDDHCYWPAETQQNIIQQALQNQWNKIARQASIQQKQRGSDTTDIEQMLAVQIKAARSRRSYHDFLKKFTVLHEELHCDPEEFDLNFYTYGLQLYGNMPLIEPLETREINKIQELVIVVDTSDSTSGTLIKNFLRETFQILHECRHFFETCRIHILQCDDQVRSDYEVTNISQFSNILNQFIITGGGGTDFRPAFAYVEQLLNQNMLHDLRGLLYFTDGKGIYPKKRPPYQAAFLFLNDYDDTAVPPWAMRLRLEPEEFA